MFHHTLAIRREGAVIPITTLLLDGREARLEWTQDRETFRYRFESEVESIADIRQVDLDGERKVIAWR